MLLGTSIFFKFYRIFFKSPLLLNGLIHSASGSYWGRLVKEGLPSGVEGKIVSILKRLTFDR